MKLHRQFLLLHERYGAEKETQTTLAEVADTLDCTHRSALTVIGKMADAGWIEWSSKRGRGKRSGLSFRITPEEIAARSVAEAIGRGDIRGVAGEFGGEAPTPAMRDRLRDSLRDYFGHHSETRTGRQVDTLRLPIRQQLHSLDPLRTNLLAESFVAGHVFDGLVRQEEGTDGILPALAHYWESDDSGRVWTFYLRKDVQFHDGRVLDAEDVVYTFERMKRLPERTLYGFMFRNAEKVSAAGPLTVRIALRRAHALFLPFLCTSRAAIVPKEKRGRGGAAAEFGRRPVGTGPFKVTQLSRDLCVLEAFGPYFMGRAHLDRVEIVNIPWRMQTGDESGGETESPFQILPGSAGAGGGRAEDDGHSGEERRRGEWSRAHAEVFSRKFVTCNTKSGPLRDPALRTAVMDALAAKESAVGAGTPAPADGPAQAKASGGESPPGPAAEAARADSCASEPPAVPELGLVTIPQYRKDAALIRERLERSGYACRVKIVPVEDFKGAARLQTDLILFSLIRDRDEHLRLFDLYLTLSEHTDSQTRQFIRRSLSRVAGEETPRRRALELDAIEARLIAEHQLRVLYEVPLQTSYLPSVRGLRFGGQGWVDLRTVWFPPSP
ncbi:ABC transporter substrate-binding protein [Saccharibacillus sp. CPCC 101409]|uniref:ABC transporter substrate-binding protein n=1 Tax=Saccharibacillus sp. CPCC 101409 TaxID=3058041 RepID=UPI0026711D2E|nr:ABC transporter substrate-binding protein [Saccharibacillus sp. CPCC 101409]MDO3409973.1 ABC transporter substrate-binding protein [Saccharibacillus sp. CPCC 101409]